MNRPDPKASSTPATDTLDRTAGQGDDAMHQFVVETAAPALISAVPWRVQAEAWRDNTSKHIRAQPMRSVVIAAGAGMALVLLAGVLSQ